MSYRLLRKKSVVVVCPKCSFERKMEVDKADTRDLGDGIVENGISCSNCDAFTHSFYENPILRHYRELLRAIPNHLRPEGKKKFIELFHAEQKRIAGELELRKLKSESEGSAGSGEEPVAV